MGYTGLVRVTTLTSLTRLLQRQRLEMLESRIEAATNTAAKKAGGRSFKWTSPGHPGVPDRIVFLPGGRIIFVELKAPGKKPTPLQAKVHATLRALGADVRVVDSMEAVNALFV